jgi:hypothetical protein
VGGFPVVYSKQAYFLAMVFPPPQPSPTREEGDKAAIGLRSYTQFNGVGVRPRKMADELWR